MDRKSFIKKTGLAVFSMSMIGKVMEASPGIFSSECATTNDILGPFYRPDAPVRNDLRIKGVPGNEIEISGTVFENDCKTPLSNAKVEIWHCDTAGNYDNDSKEFRHRAIINTDKNGHYSALTILPGKYLNGRLYRPAHIHFRVSGAGHKELISQIYFQGDPHITEDPWASKKKAEHRILPLFPDDVKSSLGVKFDIYLKA
jgi:protocatechuate 3,4-dioxygenase beta subunit